MARTIGVIICISVLFGSLVMQIAQADSSSQPNQDPTGPESSNTSQVSQPTSLPEGKDGKVAILVVRQLPGGLGQDIYWSWLSWPAFNMMAPFMQPIQSFSSPYTQQISSWILGSMPMAPTLFDQYNQWGSQMSSVFSLNNYLGSMGGSISSNLPFGLPSMFGGTRPGSNSEPAKVSQRASGDI